MKVSQIKIDLELKGHGIINYGGQDQQKCVGRQSQFNNISYAKKNYYKDENGEITEKVKISSYCFRLPIYQGSIASQSQDVFKNPELTAFLVAQPQSQLQGYMCPAMNLSKKACFSIPYLEEVGNVVIQEELFTKKGLRDENSLFYKETVGETKYKATAFFDVEKAQFLNLDVRNDEKALNEECYEGEDNPLEKAFKNIYKRIPYEIGPFIKVVGKEGNLDAETIKNLSTMSEYGLKFDDQYINELLSWLVKRLYTYSLARTNSDVRVTRIVLTPIYDDCPFADDKDNAIEINDKNVNDGFNFQYHQFYVKADTDVYDKSIKEFKEDLAKKQEEKKEKKENKKNKAKSKKEDGEA